MEKDQHDVSSKSKQPKYDDDHKFLSGDASRLMLLVLLYIVQGIAFGYTMTTLPVILKKHFTYTEIGIISFCSVSYNIKFLFSPLVDTKYFKNIGKRRSWIIPVQLIAG